MLSELNLMRIFDNVEALSPDSRWQVNFHGTELL